MNGLMRGLDALEEWLIAGLMGAATLVIFTAVVHRYALGIPFLYPFLFPIDMTWAQEMCIFMFVWMAKFGAAYGVRTGIHIGVDVLVNRLDECWQRRAVLLSMASGAVFTGLIGMLGGYLVWKLSYTDQTSPDMEMPMWIVYLCVPLGSGLMCFRFIQVGYRFFHGLPLPRHDHIEVDGLELSEWAPADNATEQKVRA
jgi:C4-dicarboxylate transporter DctQ subunit